MIKRMAWVFGLAWLTCVSAANQAYALDVYLNGVRITGVKNQVIEKAKVVMDKEGNVFITAKGYKVQELVNYGRAQSASIRGATNRLTKNYYLVTEVSRLGRTGHKIQIIVNNKLIKELTDNLAQHLIELNPYLNRGANTVSIRALRSDGEAGLMNNTLNTDRFSLIIGEGGGKEGGTLKVDNVLAEFEVSAADREEKSKTFTIEAK